MEFEKIILCTDAPKGQGLAYYYYRAFCDVVGFEKISIIDEGNRNYGGSLFSRGVRRIKDRLGSLSKMKYGQLVESLSDTNNLVILFNNAGLKPIDIKKLSTNPSIDLVNYLSDSPYGLFAAQQKEVFSSIPYFKIICTFAIDLIPVLYQLGAKRVERIPFGYCKYTHLQPTENIAVEFPYKVFYFGTWSKEIEEWVKHLLVFDLVIEGNGWKNASRKELREIGTRQRPNTDHNMAIMARKAGVVVNFTRSRHGCFHTMKTFELTISGACVITNFSNEQNEFFKNEESIIYFNTAEEMTQEVRRFIHQNESSSKIKQNARVEAFKHSYHSRVTELLAVLK